MNLEHERLAPHFRTLGELRPPHIMRTVSVMVVLALLVTAAFLAFAPWVQTAIGPGQVTALRPDDRLQDLNALVGGRIDKWFVQDGSIVKAGDPIVRIIDNDPLLLQRLEAERAQVEAQLNANIAAERTARLDLERTRQLFEEGLAARREFEAAQIRVAEFEARVAEARAQRARIDVSVSRQSAQTVYAPRDGFILQITAGDGSTAVSAGDRLATFLPADAEIAVEIYVSGRDAPLIRPGRKVRLQFEGWPAVQFAGWPSVAVGTFGGEVVSVDPSASENGRFRVLVQPDPAEPKWPDARFIRFGAKAQGWILLETVSVGFEVWRQLNNFPPAAPRDIAPPGAGGVS